MAELIPAGTGETAWVDFTVTQGAPRALFLKSASGNGPAPAGVNFMLAHKTDGGRYQPFVKLNASNINDKGGVTGAGTYGIKRLAGRVNDACGLDIEGT